jgi:hypothetical protein
MFTDLIQFPIIIGLYQAVTKALAVTPINRWTIPTIYLFIKPQLINQPPVLRMDLSQPERLYILGLGSV